VEFEWDPKKADENDVRPFYDVAPGGRFLINVVADDAISPITLQNWMPPAK
jgi:hypothetical protein